MTYAAVTTDDLVLLREYRRRLSHRPVGGVEWQPLPGPQSMALASDADVIGYGGAAGGGKTDLLLGAAGTQHQRSIIFRRVFPSIRAMIERSRELFARGQSHAQDSYNEQLHLWRLIDGRQIEFGSLQYEADKRKYQGRPYDLYGFDEATEFPESFIRFVTAWNRTTLPGQRCRVILTFNPPMDDDGQWIIAYFAPWIDPDYTGERAMPGELRYFAMVDGRECEVAQGTPNAKSRTFIPASLSDNPYLLATGYDATIDALPEPLRSFLKGDFAAGRQSDPWKVLPAAWVRAAQQRWTPEPPALPLSTIGVDVARGGKDQTTLARRYGQWYAPLDVYPGSDTPNGQAVATLVLSQHADDALVAIDVIGVGASPYDHLAGLVPTQAVNASAAARDDYGTEYTDASGRLHFGNMRAYLWWRFREALDPETGDGLMLPDDPDLRVELCAPKFFVRTGRIWVESKDEVKTRIGRSTDRADAVIQAHLEAAPLFLWSDASDDE